jgi:O-antigen/teichoic acid export membrane protein
VSLHEKGFVRSGILEIPTEIETPSCEDSGPSPSHGSGRTTLAAMAMLATVIRTVVVMLAGFAATPLLIRYLGTERFGALRASQQWAGYAVYLYFGLDAALCVLALEKAGRGQLLQLAALTRTALKLILRQSLVVVLPAFVLLAWFMPVLVPVSSGLRIELRIASLVGAVAVPLAAPQFFGAVLGCLQRSYLQTAASLSQSLVGVALAVWLAWLGYGLVGQSIAFVAASAVCATMLSWFALGRMPGFFQVRAIEVDSARLTSLRWPLTLAGTGNQINLMTDYIVVALVATPAAVTSFLVTQRLVAAVCQSLGAVAGASWAGLSEILASERRALLQERTLELVRFVMGFGLTVGLTAAAYDARFVDLWIGAEHYGGDRLALLTSIQGIVFNFLALFSFMIDVQGHTRDRVWMSTTGSATNLGLSFLLGKWLGLYGVTLATVVAYSATDAWYDVRVYCQRFGVEARAVTREVARATLIAIPWIALVWWVAHRSEVAHGWVPFTLEFIAVNVAAAIYAVALELRAGDRSLWRERIGRYLALRLSERRS